LRNFEAGKLGEFICAVRLMKLGVSCEIVNLDTIDIVANHEGRLIRIQVKSSELKRQRRYWTYQFVTSVGGKKRPLNKKDCDLVALVALDCERVLFKPVESLLGQITKRILPRKFDNKFLESKTWEASLAYLD
jgi:hypothetical protein|tara:strand:- start:1754 stop:2152 length:399 start_codon:yes stop_codon:yes gene_type:complete